MKKHVSLHLLDNRRVGRRGELDRNVFYLAVARVLAWRLGVDEAGHPDKAPWIGGALQARIDDAEFQCGAISLVRASAAASLGLCAKALQKPAAPLF